ncbi:hypothetical protein [Sporosarcina cascadiensis]|nr:hypothetical protein [Sporosarcina cascadiensis]
MTVIVDCKNDTVHIQGDIEELGDLTIDKDAYIDLVKGQAEHFISGAD